MPTATPRRWTTWVVRYHKWIVLFWIALAVAVRSTAPTWDQVALDGDFDYLPADLTSVAGGRLLNQAFPGERSRSQLVFLLCRDDGELTKQDEILGLDLLRRLYHRLAEASWQRAIRYGYESGPTDPDQPYASWIALTRAALDEAIRTDEAFYDAISESVPDTSPTPTEPRMAIAYWDRGNLLRSLHEPDDAIARDVEAAVVFCPTIATETRPIAERDIDGWDHLIDIWSWNDSLVGGKLRTDQARLVVGRLSTELASTSNIATFEAAGDLIRNTVAYSGRFVEPGVRLHLTGSAAIGGETLSASRDAIRYTEWFTVGMILVLLTLVYRSPLLVMIPIVSIGVALVVASGTMTHLASWSAAGALPLLDLRIFTTSRIFIVVILFGAGTDYCLFLIARLREESTIRSWPKACASALSNVSGALLGSALTTIVGLGTLAFADFGKFQSTGPVIAVCLFIALLVCLSLTPAILYWIGPIAFWPMKITENRMPTLTLSGSWKESGGVKSRTWSQIALMLTRAPAMTLGIGMVLLVIPAGYGYVHESDVTYDLSGQLGAKSVTTRGMAALRNHFSIGEINPVTLMMVAPKSLPADDLQQQVKSLAETLYGIDGVIAVRTADDPLGERKRGLFSRDALFRRALRNHRIAQRHFFSDVPDYAGRLIRMDVVLEGNPFDQQTAQLLENLTDRLSSMTKESSGIWTDYDLYLTGTTPSIVDLRQVTIRDNRTIKIAVILAVLCVLILVIRRIGVSLYLILTVLLSYYATLGLTVIFFSSLYGDSFLGLDWKLPLFLFVILVAVGQDYNVYLVTRILEEQRKGGWLMAVRRSVARTGGIISACGLVMAATFFSMTASAWFPSLIQWMGVAVEQPTTLQGIIQLGFALGLGVLIDTFYVRTILVPSFFAMLGRAA
ncbi:MMPL family transporter [Crateriforma conspicua]|uniref:Putative membrane protein YdgH n=1 Tax=Crateriforma conspicua TaxID=2527996 RepID=A0A5C6FH45_9PLAN|nr:MMPL family transporter [Crateriforma conspicua]TWU61051.1 putative membrane protein YdgH [Crateriforma conspicua]